MYELLIRLYYELDYKRFTIDELKEMKEILNQFNGELKEKINSENYRFIK